MEVTQRNRFVSGLTAFTAMMTLVLLCAGALVTSTGSGLAVPDWPLSYGKFFPPMIGGILYEHGHRLIAGFVALLAVFQSIVIYKLESRSAVKKLGFIAVFIVLLQASLGGATVLLRLPPQVSISHACLAQIFFCIVVALALMNTKSWFDFKAVSAVAQDKLLQVLCLIVPIAFFCQLILGATMRHTGAGLAISDFPLSQGGLVPSFFTKGVLIHYSHRVGAFTMVVLVSALVSRVYAKHSQRLQLVAVAGFLAALVTIQIMMGAMIIWLRKPVALTTGHLAVGALCLSVSVLFAILTRRHAAAFARTEVSSIPSGASWNRA